MIKKGLMIYNHDEQEWRLWIGHQSYWLQQGDYFEMRIHNQYFRACLLKDFDWFITIMNQVRFVLHINAVYKVRVDQQNFISVEDPF